jgi:2-polyprenyl-6-hydroxyphenyl methylase / 3-demethylubiquinone-9 3-methyltransferase
LSNLQGSREYDGTVDLAELNRFELEANSWWKADGSFGALHRVNPVRLGFIRSRLLSHFGRNSNSMRPFSGLRLLDVGCGGGLLAEPMARLGFTVTGIDAGAKAIAAAREHAHTGGVSIDYRIATADSLAASGKQFDAVLALEVMEHLADRDAFWRSLASLVGPGGAAILSTLNRTPTSFALAIVAAEFVLGWIPRGTHDWRKFIRPSEMVLGLRRNGLQTRETAGISYDLVSRGWALSRNLDVNYLVLAMREAR